ncbi:hypothetical protein [Massilia sp. 9096]|uniref:hypothetical protein n=1 Tax=Massilia sp. 9096 TaxID=1500894 RepID=UPI0005692B4F|nr:hypothetical protein [Massilia sp. 9096]
MRNIHADPNQRAWGDAAGYKNPPSAPPTIPPIIINPFTDQTRRPIPNPAIDPRSKPPGPPIVPPPGPSLRMAGRPRPA